MVIFLKKMEKRSWLEKKDLNIFPDNPKNPKK